MAAAAKSAQEVLGDHQDAAIAADTLDALALHTLTTAGSAWSPDGWCRPTAALSPTARRDFGPAWNAARKAVG